MNPYAVRAEDLLELALRGSWGITVNPRVPGRRGSGTIRLLSYNSAVADQRSNPDLKWESTKSINFGLDSPLLNGKIYGSIDYYDKKTTDILFQTHGHPAGACIHLFHQSAS